MPDRILILSPHTDDAELGCGGSIAGFARRGCNLLWVVFSTANESLPADMAADTLRNEFIAAAGCLGLTESDYRIFNFRVRHLHCHRQEILEELIRIRSRFDPQMVIGPSLNDFHQDHQVVANEMIRAFKTTASIICYELPWNHVTFNTQLFISLDKDHLQAKCEMLEHYKSQVAKERQYFSREFIHGLAKTRGVQCDCGYAEAFEVVRWIIR